MGNFPYFIVNLCLVTASLFFVAPAMAQQGANTCLLCHNKPPDNLILSTPHGQQADPRAPAGAGSCVGCHGASLDHAQGKVKDGKMASADINFGKDSATPLAEQNKVCLSCHEKGDNVNWHGSQHQFADLSCSSCHTLHTVKDKVLDKKTEAEVCYTCHVEQRAQANRPYGHPLVEGKMSCSDCHSPHGGTGTAMLVKNTVNETCYECHEDLRGPFLWEHQPVREDCMHCHTPHGAIHVAMTKIRTPFLCTACHSENFHPSGLRSGTGLPPAAADDRLLARDCMNCHLAVHGSNHPSGTGLTR